MLTRFFFLKCASSILLLTAICTCSLFAQNEQDILFDGSDPGALLPSDTSVYVKQEFDPKMWPALKSLAVPGWGQVHNKQVYKAPIILGSSAVLLGVGLSFRKDFLDNRAEINRRLNDGIQVEFQGTTTLDLRFDAEQARRRYRWSLASVGFVHLLNVGDAYASAFILQSDKKHSPTKAALMSAVLPGWGQIYNGRTWKTPIVVAGLAAAGYAIWFNADRHRVLRDELFARRFGDFSAMNPHDTNDGNNGRGYFGIEDDRLLQARNSVLEDLDNAILIGVLVYVLNIVDAAVDAHLRDFDIDDDLGLETALVPTIFPNGTIGVNWSLTF